MDSKFLYSLKPTLITDSEKQYFDAIKNALTDEYIVQPQVNLASIITRNDNSAFINELFRNIDFCVFDKLYHPIILIEINDQSHNSSKRKERDHKVKKICDEAGIKVVTFWTSYGVNQEYISKTVNEAIADAPNFVRIAHSAEDKDNKSQENKPKKAQKGACYIATAVYGTYDCPSVWVLRRFRDNRLDKTAFGRMVIRLYYYISPKLLKCFGGRGWFDNFWKSVLDRFVSSLKSKGYSSEPYEDKDYNNL